MRATAAGNEGGRERNAAMRNDQGATLAGAGHSRLNGDAKETTLRSTHAAPVHFQHHPSASQKLLRRLKSLSRRTVPHIIPSTRPNQRAPPVLPRIPSGLPLAMPDVSLDDAPATLELVQVQLEQRPSIKVRLVTFNMHDSLPEINGDLSGFLGEMGIDGMDLGSGEPSQGSRDGSVVEVLSPVSLPAFPLSPDHPYHLIVVAGQECPTASGVLAGKMPRAWDGRGWTSILENWLCGGAGDDDSASSEGDQGSDEGEQGDGSRSKRSAREKGPYVLVEKERLIPGIYLAIFVARSCDALIDGISKGKVTAGLLGGRLGNKGAVAISLSFAGSRLLFISAHLAAHASKIGLANRKANVRKIFDEMVVDDFSTTETRDLPLTDRFDQTFFLGDLNFRLQLSRLHADYLLQSKDYATAVQFDELRQWLLEDDTCFQGFKEGTITFAPTYKYDVVARIKRKRSGLIRSKSIATRPRGLTVSVNSGSRPITPDIDNDAASIVSSTGSMSSGMSDYERVGVVDPALPPTPTKGTESSLEAMKRAQVRFLTLVRSNSGIGREYDGRVSAKKALLGSGSTTPTRPILRTSASRDVRSSFESGEERIPVVPVFDTSSKKRVQSYTDRILFKTTVLPTDIDTTPPAHSRNLSAAIVDSIRGLVHLPSPSHSTTHPSQLQHTYFAARPVLDHPSRKIHGNKSSEPWSDVASMAGDPRHSRFANFFGRGNRRGLRSMSVESLGMATEGMRAPKKLRRARSLTTATRQRRISGTPSFKAPDWHASTRPFWKRAGSSPGRSPPVSPMSTPPATSSMTPAVTNSTDISSLASPRSDLLSPPSTHTDSPSMSTIGSPLFTDSGISGTSTTPSTPHITHSTPPPSPPLSKQHARRSQSVSNSPRHPPLPSPSSPPLATPHRKDSSYTTPWHRRSSSAFPRSNTRTSREQPSNNTFVRFKSFLHFLPAIPFLNRSSEGPSVVVEKVGPRRGEIQVIKYDAVTDLEAMGAISDHRPVFVVVAIGVGPPETA